MHATPTRRHVLRTGLAAAGGAALSSAAPRSIGAARARRDPAPRLLVLGGTRFLGPAVVESALAQGFEVTLFNRGQSHPGLFADAGVTELRGDRDAGDLSALEEGRWDSVVDTSGYVPGQVRAAAELLGPRIGHYVFVSTISVYADTSAANVDESTPVARVEPEVVERVKTIREAFAHYGPMKALCEEAAEAALPGRVANVRPGLIVGPGDPTDRFTYWPVRVRRGGEVLAPARRDAEVQVVDVRDLGAWIVDLCARAQPGLYNAVGFRGRLGFEEFLHGCKVVTGADCSFTWPSEEFLLEREVRPYADLPLWLPAGVRGHIDVSRALAQGLAPRPVGDTIRDTVAWHDTRPAGHELRAGLTPEREAELLAAWHARDVPEEEG